MSLAHAKVNLGLAVLARRGDAFHEIETLMARLDLADAVELTLRDVPAGEATLRTVADPQPGTPAWHARSLADVPEGSENLAIRAATHYLQAFEKETGERPPGVHVDLVKRVPVAAGLGGGSSDAAAVLRELDRLLPAGLDLGQLAGGLGSDVPFFASGLRAAVARGRGERLHEVDVPRLHLVLAKPEATVSAAEAYAALIGFTPRLKHDAALDALRAGEEPRWRNGLQPGVVRDRPQLRTLLEELREAGLRGVIMSGSGPTCFGVADDAQSAKEVAARLATRRPELWVAHAVAG